MTTPALEALEHARTVGSLLPQKLQSRHQRNCETIRKELQEAERLREAAKWRPIETAPKDGTEILMCDEDGFVFSGEYDLAYSRFGIFTHQGLMEFQHPTHWKPLPDAATIEGVE